MFRDQQIVISQRPGLGLSATEESFELLLHAVEKLSVDELYDRITRRKSIEALGRRKDLRAIPTLVAASEAALIPRLSLMQLLPWSALVGSHSPIDIDLLLSLLNGEVTQIRAVIQAHTRLTIRNPKSQSANL